MQVYLVGGAVRDERLGLPVRERDWCVVGATPDELINDGYKQVGKDFPVFLHPESGEEYALARTERKTAAGYHGFAFDTSPSVSIEEDLSRRDLTINALALDTNGELIDPFGGLQDIENRLIRHVSDAFVEDPVRILRAAKFAARFADLGFRIAPQTRDLMRQMARLLWPARTPSSTLKRCVPAAHYELSFRRSIDCLAFRSRKNGIRKLIPVCTQ